jgi:demethylmenaquinone methyltransferase/2-methoxy-6-polyprenyl-1,4-benzoquinol methylase
MTDRDRLPLRASLESPETRGRYVRRLFATIADRYDLITVLLSGGRDRRWKDRLAEISAATSTTRALDLACGTGDIAYRLRSRGAEVVAMDVTFHMLELAARKQASRQPGVKFVAGDMMSLPFADERFDVVTTGYGIRNVPSIAPALREIHRVLRPRGLLLSLDFNRPDNPLVRAVYLAYLTVVGSTLGLLLHRDPDTYRYIPESIRKYPGAEGVCAIARDAGFAECRIIPVLGGLMAIHLARKE